MHITSKLEGCYIDKKGIILRAVWNDRFFKWKDIENIGWGRTKDAIKFVVGEKLRMIILLQRNI